MLFSISSNQRFRWISERKLITISHFLFPITTIKNLIPARILQEYWRGAPRVKVVIRFYHSSWKWDSRMVLQSLCGTSLIESLLTLSVREPMSILVKFVIHFRHTTSPALCLSICHWIVPRLYWVFWTLQRYIEYFFLPFCSPTDVIDQMKSCQKISFTAWVLEVLFEKTSTKFLWP